MAYTINHQAPKVRRDAVLFAKKHGVRCAARRYGVAPSTVSKWRKKTDKLGLHLIPTISSRPKYHPRELSNTITDQIVDIRLEHNRSAEVVHRRLKDEHGIRSFT